MEPSSEGTRWNLIVQALASNRLIDPVGNGVVAGNTADMTAGLQQIVISLAT